MRPSSYEIYLNACKVIPGGVNSPVRAFQKVGIPPLIAKGGAKDRIIDQDGHSYIDYCMSWGALILGHAPSQIIEAAISQVRQGSTFGVATHIEEQLASKVVSLIPSIEKIRFVSTGTEATMSAIRLARAFTGRPKIVKFSGCYHGHSDALLTQAGSGLAYLNSQATSKGVTAQAIADTITLPFNDFDRALALFADPLVAPTLAAVILEPIPANMGVVLPDPAFLRALRSETKRLGALLIFDEVITGFRVGLQGAQGLYGITPDLTCLGKIIGGGFPAAAFGGRAEIMDQLAPLGEVYQAGTLSGNPVAMSAGLAMLCELEQPGFYEHLECQTNILTDPIRECIKRTGIKAAINQAGSMFTLFLGVSEVKSREDLDGVCPELFAQFFRALFKEKIYLPPLQQEAAFVSRAHTKESLLYTADCMIHTLNRLSADF